GGAVAAIIILLNAERFLARHIEEALDVVADALVHLLPQIEVMRIERVVEIEHPRIDVGEAARRRVTNRCRHPSLPESDRGARAPGKIDGGKAGGIQSLAGAILVLAELELDVAGAQLRAAAPVECLVDPFDHLAVAVDCFAEAVEAARLAGEVGLEAFA